MSRTPVSPEILNPHSLTTRSPAALEGFDLKLARPFIYKSISEETRSAYHRAIREFFEFVRRIHPTQVTASHVIAYRDHLRINKRRKANTVATKLAIVRSFFEYLRAGGSITVNPATTKLVTPPELPTDPQGRALTPREVRLEFDRPLSTRMVQKIVTHWAEFTGIGHVTPHDLRRTESQNS